MSQSVLEYNLSCFSFKFFLLIFGKGLWESRQSYPVQNLFQAVVFNLESGEIMHLELQTYNLK